ncbi:peptidoglycan DD-metalloendopeptidase family protein [Streptomyces sp. NPDC014864]|uniref:peptidoglycan DD-metalloendopeptidase family protein n=1 Tax=Streptomyces sp. NPDC014864 TaxID=3364924 RepID=UPI0036FB09E5
MNDRHPSGTMTTPAPASDAASAPYASYGGPDAVHGDFTTYGDYDATGFHTGTHLAHGTAGFASDPLFGELPDGGHSTGTYDTAHWTTGSHQAQYYDAYAAQHHAAHDTGAYETGAYDATAWTAGHQPLTAVPPQSAPVDALSDASGQWDANTWLQPGAPRPDQPGTGTALDGTAPDGTTHWDWGTQTFDTGAYDATQWNTAGTPADASGSDGFDEVTGAPATATFDQVAYDEPSAADDELSTTGALPPVGPLLDDQEEAAPAPRSATRAAGRSRRRTPAKRSALLTVAVPSACVMGVAGIAAASVGGLTDDSTETTASASEAHAVQPATANNKLDTQLQSLSAGADDFADRASRTQERIDLKAQQVAEAKKAAEEAARKERLRPKFVLPVLQKGLSAYFGQAGVNWMSVHTGIDFPVSYGTTVMAATDGTVRTQWNSAYGNMLILTAKDGTETWYCHLSSYRVPSGTVVKAGTPIAYSGNSGNSTGPHLHFEVRPGGGAAVDPLPWLRSHGLDPT